MAITELLSRKIGNDKPLPVWLILCEGRNKTETTYFNHFSGRDKKIRLIVMPSIETDPASMFKRAKNLWAEKKLHAKNGDRLFCLIDTDLSDSQLHAIMTEKVKKSNIEFVLSNPCFEVWFFFHFEDFPKRFASSNQAKDRLKKYIPDYKENLDVFDKVPTIQNNIRTAIERLQRRKQLLEKDGIDLYGLDGNPYTDVHILMQEILNHKQ